MVHTGSKGVGWGNSRTQLLAESLESIEDFGECRGLLLWCLKSVVHKLKQNWQQFIAVLGYLRLGGRERGRWNGIKGRYLHVPGGALKTGQLQRVMHF